MLFKAWRRDSDRVSRLIETAFVHGMIMGERATNWLSALFVPGGGNRGQRALFLKQMQA